MPDQVVALHSGIFSAPGRVLGLALSDEIGGPVVHQAAPALEEITARIRCLVGLRTVWASRLMRSTSPAFAAVMKKVIGGCAS